MGSREAIEWIWESENDLRPVQNAPDPALLELYPLLDMSPAVFPAGLIPAPDQNAVAPAQPAATLAPAAHNAGGNAASPQFFITTQEALDSGIVLAVPVRAKDLAPSEEEDYGHTSDEEVENENLGEDNWSSDLLDKEFKSPVSQPQPPSQDYTAIRVNHSEEDQLAGLKAGAVGSTTTPEHMSPTLSSTTIQEDQTAAVDVSPAASSITVSKLLEDDVPAAADHVDVLDSPTDTLVGEDGASINKLQEEVARALGSGSFIANPDLVLISAKPVTAVTSEDAAGSQVISTLLESSLNPIQDQEGSITSTALQKKEEQVISSESSELNVDSTT